eukprot:4724814-Prymnesium_polylepis.1
MLSGFGPAIEFELTETLVRDLCFQISTQEGARMCAEMPDLHHDYTPDKAIQLDAANRKQPFGGVSVVVPRDVRNEQNILTASSTLCEHVRNLTELGRLPLMSGMISNKIVHKPPISTSESQGTVFSISTAIDH